jgi:hypothetical protein
MRNVRTRGIASNDFSWADRIAELLGASALSSPTPTPDLVMAKANPAVA